MVAVFTASQWRHQLGQASVQFTQLSGTGRPNHHSSRSNKKKHFPTEPVLCAVLFVTWFAFCLARRWSNVAFCMSLSWRCFEAPTLTGQETFSHGACPRYEGPNSLKPPSQPLRTYTTRSCDILTLQAYHTPPLPLPSPASDRDLRVGLKHVDLEVKRLEEAAGRQPRVAKGLRGPTHAGIQLIVQLEGEPPSAAHG